MAALYCEKGLAASGKRKKTVVAKANTKLVFGAALVGVYQDHRRADVGAWKVVMARISNV